MKLHIVLKVVFRRGQKVNQMLSFENELTTKLLC